MNRRFRSRKIAGFVLMGIVGVLAFGGIVMLLWNALMPGIFNLPVIDFWHALGLLVLSKILFGGFRGGPRGNWKMHGLKDRWANMTPEERERFKQDWGRRCGKPFPGDRDDPRRTTDAEPEPRP